MTIPNPSHLLLRNGIYYFQMRIPSKKPHGGEIKALIRRSTGTGKRREALNIARLWWAEVMTDKYDESEVSRKIDEEAELYHVGLQVWNTINVKDVCLFDGLCWWLTCSFFGLFLSLFCALYGFFLLSIFPF